MYESLKAAQMQNSATLKKQQRQNIGMEQKKNVW